MLIRALSLFAIAFTLPLGAQEIRIAISDLLGSQLKAPLEAYAEGRDVSFEIQSIGSLPSMDKLGANEIDIAIIAQPLDASPIPSQYKSLVFAYEAPVVIVSSGNPVNEVSLGGLGGIFGSSEEQNFQTWSDLGFAAMGSRKIKPYVGQDDDSIAFELFRHIALTSGAVRANVAYVNDDEVEALVTADNASIAVISRLPTEKNIKTMLISSREGSPAYGPNVDNIHFGDYPIRLPFYIVYNERDESRLKDVLRVLLSADVSELLEANNFFPLPNTVRRKMTFDLDLED